MIRQIITIDDHGLFGRLERYPEILDEEAHTAVWAILLYLKPLVRRFTPVGAMRYLRSSIFTQVTGHAVDLLGRIATPAAYGETIELGRTPGKKMPPEGSLVSWIALKFGVSRDEAEDIEYPVRKMIGKFGFSSIPEGAQMFKKALAEAQGFIRREKAALATRIARRLEGR